MPRAKFLGFALLLCFLSYPFPLLSCRAICGFALPRAQLQLCLPGQALVWTNTPRLVAVPNAFLLQQLFSSSAAVVSLSPSDCLPWTSSILCSFLS
ncbi:hypothetical protein WR25_13872 [Diploscapter pachys]|uniref:Secreted protein n=1 Tax=Diploscapter pachys TaxID=2018661 RepID=A0A2A2KY91_9BILA|nr:hypothetical protein WR25_13872 [Diploscapter pachys]